MENIQSWRCKHYISLLDDKQLRKDLRMRYWRGFMKHNGWYAKAKKVVKV